MGMLFPSQSCSPFLVRVRIGGARPPNSSRPCLALNQLMAFRRGQPPQSVPSQHIPPPYSSSYDAQQQPPPPPQQPMPQSTDVASPNMSNKRARHELDQGAVPNDDGFVHDPDAGESGQDDDDDDDKPKTDKKAGRRKIKIEFIQDKSRRHITFSKRKAGIMKKVRTSLLFRRSPARPQRFLLARRVLQAYELSTLTGTQVLLLVVSETGLVYTFTTAKLQPLVTQPEGKNLIQACLNAPHGQLPSSMPVGAPINRTSMPMQHPPNVPGGLAIGSGSSTKEDEAQEESEDAPISGDASGRGNPRKRRRASSSVNQPRGNTSPVVSGASGAPQAGAPSQSPHARPGQIPPGAPPIAIPGVPPPMPLEHSPRQGAQAAPPPTSPNYAQPAGGYPPPPASGDPNLYAHQQHGGYPGAPPQASYGFGHEGAPPPAVSQNPWAPQGVQHGGQYARR